MPTLSDGTFAFGSADAALLDRRVRVLPCGYCGLRGPHGFRIQANHGLSVICESCESEVREDAVQHTSDPLHRSPSAAR